MSVEVEVELREVLMWLKKRKEENKAKRVETDMVEILMSEERRREREE